MWREVRRKRRTQVRHQNVKRKGRGTTEAANRAAQVSAWSLLVETYAGLAECGAHLFGDLLNGQMPKQWRHYPEDDAIDQRNGFHWFYHSHSPEDRQGAAEHGHIHLFARRKLWAHRLRSAREMEFANLKGEPAPAENTRHLLTIGFDAKGIPATMATVNSWVTGDRMLSAGLTAELLSGLKLDTGHAAADAVIESLVAMHSGEICELLDQRDKTLFGWRVDDVLSDQRLEILSEIRIDVDKKLRRSV